MNQLHSVRWVACALCALATAQELSPDQALTLELHANDPVLERHGPSRTLAYDVAFEGKLYVWAASEDFDPMLRVSAAAGRVLGEDDDSGGGTTAFLVLDVRTDGPLSIAVAAADAGASGELVLHVSEAPETDATRTAAESAQRAAAEADAATQAGEPSRAREIVAKAIADLLAVEGGERSALLTRAAARLGGAKLALPDPTTTRRADERVVRFFARTLPADHLDLQRARLSLARTLRTTDLGGARALQAGVVEALERTLAPDAFDLQRARIDLASTLMQLGDARGAKTIQEKALAALERTLSDNDPAVQIARGNLALSLLELGELSDALALQEKVLDVRLRKLEEEHPDVQSARLNLAATLQELGELGAARALQEKVLEVRSRTLHDEHPDLLAAQNSLGTNLYLLGEYSRARALFERGLEVRARTLRPDHHDVVNSLQNLGGVLHKLGDLTAARQLQERVLAARARTLPSDDRYLQSARMNLGQTMFRLGDLDGARALFESALAVLSRTRRDDDADLQAVRESLAMTMYSQGDYVGSRPLQQAVVDAYSRTRSVDDHRLLNAQQNLAAVLKSQGELEAARALEERVLEVRSRAPEEHPDLQTVRQNLARTMKAMGDVAGARVLEEKALAARSRVLPNDHPDLQHVRRNLTRTLIELEDLSHARTLAGQLERGTVEGILAALRELSSREAEARVQASLKDISLVLSLSAGAAALDDNPLPAARAFSLVETARSAGLWGARWSQSTSEVPGMSELRDSARRSSAELARLAANGANPDAIAEATRARDQAQRRILEQVRSNGAARALDSVPEADALRRQARDGAALVGFWSYAKLELGESRSETTDSLLAFVVKADGSLARVELGPIEPIEKAVADWRAELGAATVSRSMPDIVPLGGPSVDALGERVRELVFDPLRGALGDASHLIVALDDVLHLVPLDALPFDDGCVGDEFSIDVRSTLWELLLPRRAVGESDSLLVLGGVDYDASPQPLTEPVDPITQPINPSERPPATAEPSVARVDRPVVATPAPGTLSGTASVERDEPSGVASSMRAAPFATLPATKEEIEGIQQLFEKRFGADHAVRVLTGTRASRAALEHLAPNARFVHLATHGYFAPDSVASTADPRPIDAHLGIGTFTTRDETLRGLSPMVLCGLGLTGANLPRDLYGRARGVITAEEISALDLSSCELAVLSACDTNVGVRRAGQGVASLQKALHIAGARSVITSLWKVPDAATRELMVDFYRRMWIEKKPKAQALWEAKVKLRDAEDENGRPRYVVRDWAAWVLTGEPE